MTEKIWQNPKIFVRYIGVFEILAWPNVRYYRTDLLHIQLVRYNDGYNDVRIKEKPIKEKTFKETDKKKQVIYEDVKKGIWQKMM